MGPVQRRKFYDISIHSCVLEKWHQVSITETPEATKRREIKIWTRLVILRTKLSGVEKAVDNVKEVCVCVGK